MYDAPRPRPAGAHAPPCTVTEIPTAWAGGRQVAVPGLGVGRLLREGPPRVVEVPLGAPVAGVFVVEGEIGASRAVILADPDVDPELLDRLVDSGGLVEAEAHAVLPPRIPSPRGGLDGGAGYAVVWLAGVAAAIALLLASADSDTMRTAMAPETTASAVTVTAPAAF